MPESDSELGHVVDDAMRELILHDRTIQSLFGLGLHLEECIHLVEDSPAQAKERLDRAINGLNGIIAEIRDRIDELGRQGLDETG